MNIPVDTARKLWRDKPFVLEHMYGTHLCCNVDFDEDVVTLTPIGGEDRTGPGVKDWEYLEDRADCPKAERIQVKLIRV